MQNANEVSRHDSLDQARDIGLAKAWAAKSTEIPSNGENVKLDVPQKRACIHNGPIRTTRPSRNSYSPPRALTPPTAARLANHAPKFGSTKAWIEVHNLREYPYAYGYSSECI